MARGTVDVFQVALASLRERLRGGALAPGERITAIDLADELRLSATPVREALSRLAGEGLIEDRRGQGYFVRPLTAEDISDLFRINLAFLMVAQDPHRAARRPDPPGAEPGDVVRAVELLFLRWIGETGSRALVLCHRLVQGQLAPIRRLEPLIFEDLEIEAANLASAHEAGGRNERLARLRHFHTRRIRASDQLAQLYQRVGGVRQE